MVQVEVDLCVEDTLESLCELYSLLKEEDMFTAVWLKRARLSEVTLALTYEQHGFFEQAQLAYEQVGHSTFYLYGYFDIHTHIILTAMSR